MMDDKDSLKHRTSKYTPGPWEVRWGRKPYGIGPEGTDPDSQLGLDIGHVFRSHVRGHREQQEGNARLIAAAPDMLEALQFVQKALADWRDGEDSTQHPVHGVLSLEEVKYCVVDEVIRKALGESET